MCASPAYGTSTIVSRNDFTVRYKEREVLLSHVTGIDFYVSYWSEGLVGHTFLSFMFDNAPPLSISIETRPEIGEGFDPLASMFKQFELIYVVGDERDLVGVRTNHRGETIYLYRLNTSAEDARRLLQIYLKRINELADRPEFYHLLSNSCTINIVRYANAAGREGRFDIRHLFNGLVDSYLYHSGRVDTTLPFDELRRRSLINAAAQAADGAPDFSQRIRQILADNNAAMILAGSAWLEPTILERMNRERAEHDGGNERERAVERGGVKPGAGTAGHRACVKVQAGFRR